MIPQPHPLKAWREKHAMSLRALGSNTRVSYVTLSNLERGIGNPTMRVLGRICHFTGLDPRQFFPPQGKGGD